LADKLLFGLPLYPFPLLPATAGRWRGWALILAHKMWLAGRCFPLPRPPEDADARGIVRDFLARRP